jgi:monoamine oxidase
MNSVLEPLLLQDVKESILLNQEVTRMERYNNKDRQDVVRVVTSSGLVVEADMCIVSIPLGCLKASIRNESNFFCPPLSQSKQEV